MKRGNVYICHQLKLTEMHAIDWSVTLTVLRNCGCSINLLMYFTCSSGLKLYTTRQKLSCNILTLTTKHFHDAECFPWGLMRPMARKGSMMSAFHRPWTFPVIFRWLYSAQRAIFTLWKGFFPMKNSLNNREQFWTKQRQQEHEWFLQFHLGCTSCFIHSSWGGCMGKPCALLLMKPMVALLMISSYTVCKLLQIVNCF